MKTIFTVNLINEKGEITYSTDFDNKTEAEAYINRTATANALEGLQAVIKEYVSEAKQDDSQEVLANFTCEQLLFEVHRRNNIYISGWWNSDHIQEYTGLPKEYHTAFIKYCNDKAVGGELADAFEQWIESIKEELHSYLVYDWFFDIMAFGGCAEINSDSPEKYRDFLSQRLEIIYDASLGVYPFIDLSYKKEDGNEEEIYDIIFDLITVFKPHHGNLVIHLEEKMQELINDYLF